MVAQLSFDFKNLIEFKPPKKPNKRVRYIVPTYYKFYSIYQYDRQKFRQLMNEWLSSPEGKNRTLGTLKEKQNEVLEQCYIKDVTGLKRDSDEEHIFRSATLQKIYSLIFYYCDVFPTGHDETRNIGDVICYMDEQQAEIKNTWQLPIAERLKLHIRLLRLLRKGFSIEESVERVKNENNTLERN